MSLQAELQQQEGAAEAVRQQAAEAARAQQAELEQRSIYPRNAYLPTKCIFTHENVVAGGAAGGACGGGDGGGGAQRGDAADGGGLGTRLIASYYDLR